MGMVHTGLQQIGDIADGAVTEAKLGAAAVTKTKFGGSVFKSAIIAGGAPGDHTVTGIAVGDVLVRVYHLSSAAAIATMADLTAEFEGTDKGITATDTITNTGGNSTADDQLLVFWEDIT